MRSNWWQNPLVWVELFALGNLAFLGVDIFIAHAVNRFAVPAEWIPIGFSPSAAGLLLVAQLLGMASGEWMRRLGLGLGIALGVSALFVGIGGVLFHLESQFFEDQTLKNLVYTAPFVAPLAYAGVGLLIILDRMVDARTVEWARWVVLLALGGFGGNFVLCLADHAQNGFFRPEEWIGVIASAWAVGFLLATVVIPTNRPLVRLTSVVMAVQVLVGVFGFFLHLRGNFAVPMPSAREKFLYGAPIFAPLLFADLAVLAAIGLWALGRSQSPASASP